MSDRRSDSRRDIALFLLFTLGVLFGGASLGMQFAEYTLPPSRGEIRCERVEVVPAGAHSVARCAGGGR